MKIEPGLFLVARASMKPRVLELPLEVLVGRFSLEKKQAAGDGTWSGDRPVLARAEGRAFKRPKEGRVLMG